jgi:hypothetical protein
LHGFADDARITLERAREQHVVHKQARGWVDVTTGLLAEACLATGDNRRAREMAEAVGAQPHARVNLLRATLSQARVFRGLDGVGARDRVASILDEADRLVEESGAIAFGPLILEERARMSQLAGDADRARRELENALDGYRACAAAGHVARLEMELGG